MLHDWDIVLNSCCRSSLNLLQQSRKWISSSTSPESQTTKPNKKDKTSIINDYTTLQTYSQKYFHCNTFPYLFHIKTWFDFFLLSSHFILDVHEIFSIKNKSRNKPFIHVELVIKEWFSEWVIVVNANSAFSHLYHLAVFMLHFLHYKPTRPVSSNIYRPTINSTGLNLKTTLMTINSNHQNSKHDDVPNIMWTCQLCIR